MSVPCERSRKCIRARHRYRSSVWFCNLLLLSANPPCRGFVRPWSPPSQRLYIRQHDSLSIDSHTASDEEIKETIELIAMHAEQKVEFPSDMISGSINVTKIEFHQARPRSATDHYSATVQNDTITVPQRPLASAGPTLRSIWRRRNARTAEEGIRREKTGQLSDLLAKADEMDYATGRRYGARTIMGLIHALAEEAADLDVEIDARRDTPLWGKQVDAIRIKFSRLGFKPLRMGGLDQAFHEYKMKFPDTEQGAFHMDRQLYDLSCADEAFERIDVDNSGALDSEEIADALAMAARSSDETEYRKLKSILRGLASELVALYDFNGDGVVDRFEYQTLVEDMAALKEQQEMTLDLNEKEKVQSDERGTGSWFSYMKGAVLGLFKSGNITESGTPPVSSVGASQDRIEDFLPRSNDTALQINGDSRPSKDGDDSGRSFRNVPTSFDWANGYSSQIREVTDEQFVSLMSSGKDLGSITISDLKLDLRRLLFGAIPFIKHITPGGPLILEPFTTTVTASFNSNDVKKSFLLDAGLRRLVAQAIRRRVRSLRDAIDGAVFYGRTWKMSSKTAPVVDVIAIEDVEFDEANRLILTGRVRVQTSPEQPVVENAFKLRARLGTNASGRRIRLVEPELALVLECPRSWEKIVKAGCDVLGISELPRPKPLYFFFPIYSPFKMEDPDNDGFDLGEDNQIKSIYIKENALRFELSAVLRPGRFLGNHYLAFTVPNRTFIITLDRVKEGIRAARKMKQAAKAVEVATTKKRRKLPTELRLMHERKQAGQVKRVQPKSFFSRFVDGYVQAERDDASSARVTKAIRDFFSRQSGRRDDTNNGAEAEDR